MAGEAKYLVGLEDRLERNYDNLKEPMVAKEVVDFLRQNPNPKNSPFSSFMTTLTMKRLTKVFFHTFDRLEEEDREKLGIKLDQELFDIALSYSNEGIRRIETGEVQDEPFGFSQRSLEIMLGHWYGHVGNIHFRMAELNGKSEELFETAYGSFAKSTSLCELVDPLHSARTYSRKSDAAYKLAEVSDRKEHWLLRAHHDIEQCIEGLPEEEMKHAVFCVANKADISLKMSEFGHDVERWIDEAYEEYKNAAVGFEEIDPSRVGYMIANMSKALSKKAEFYGGKKRRKLLEKAYQHQLEASEASWNHDAKHAIYQLSFAGTTAREIATLYHSPEKKKEAHIKSSDKQADAGRYAAILCQISRHPVSAAADEYPSFVEAIDRIDQKEFVSHAAYALSYAGDERFSAAELEDNPVYKERLLVEAIEMAKEGADLIKKSNRRHWAMTYSNMAKFAKLAYEVTENQRYYDQSMNYAKVASKYFVNNPSKVNDDVNRAMMYIINDLNRRKNQLKDGNPHRKSKSQRIKMAKKRHGLRKF